MIEWQAQRFQQLSGSALYKLLKLRVDVFVVEQHCPYPELDNLDLLPDAWHLLGFETDGTAPPRLLAYARILPPDDRFPGPSIGRVVVSACRRRQKLGLQLMQQAIQQARTSWPGQPIHLSAQAHLQPFYQQLDFEAEGGIYLEDGIPHRHMLLPSDQPHQSSI